jgi:hypothetical protein
VRFYVANSENTPARPHQKILSWPYIDTWTEFGLIALYSDDDSINLPIKFSWTEPPGIATETWGNPLKDAKEKKPAIMTRSVSGKTGAFTGFAASTPWRGS